MLKKLTKISLICCAMFSTQKLKAQVDPHFSQYYIYPQWLNPALTGVMDGDYRVAGIYRSQWANIDNGFKTVGAAAEFATLQDINYGVGIFQQSAGTGGYKVTMPSATINYTGIKLGRDANQHINIGISAGFIDKRFDPSKLSFGSQYPGMPSPTTEVLANPQQTYFDLGAGVMYYDATPNKKLNPFLGLSINHLTTPTDRFLATSTSTATPTLPMRRILHGGVRIAINETFSITPNGLMMDQGTAHERSIGAYAQKKIGEGMDFLGGFNWRIDDAIVPFVGLNYRDVTIGLSYDVTTSQLSSIAGSTNAIELSISYVGKKRRPLAPKQFICPRM